MTSKSAADLHVDRLLADAERFLEKARRDGPESVGLGRPGETDVSEEADHA